LFGNPEQIVIHGVGVGIAAAPGFGGTWIIMQIIKCLVGIRVSLEVEEEGLDISEHAEAVYSDEEEFKLDHESEYDHK
jgi:Amt family ammonium transporter